MIALSCEGIALSMVPERGGKITSLCALESEREWLEAPSRPVEGPGAGGDFDHGDMCGWDEMLPTIAPCRYPGTELDLPDHGELWDTSWSVSAVSGSSVSTWVEGRALPYRFERTLTLSPGRLHVEYRLSSTVDDVRVLWAAHPLFAQRPGTRIELGDAPATLVHYGEGERPVQTWPAHGVCVEVDLAAGASQKIFTHPASEVASASLIDPDGAFLTMSWRREEVPCLGVWLDNAAYARHAVAALEPTTWSDDGLDVAVGAGAAWIVSRDHDRRWSLDVELGCRAV
jgi:hypothetical protein